MKYRFETPLVILFVLFCYSAVLAGESPVVLKAKDYVPVTIGEMVKTADFETKQLEVVKTVNELSKLAAALRTAAEDAMTDGNTKTFNRIIMALDNVVENIVAIKKFQTADLDPEVALMLQSMNQRLGKVDGYIFGPNHPETFEIYPVSNTGMGKTEIITGYKEGTDDNGNIIMLPVTVTANYVVTPGLLEAKQKHKEVLVVYRLPDGEKKRGSTILYPGQDRVKGIMDPRTFPNNKGWLSFHRVCKIQVKWLKYGKGTRIPFSDNKHVKE